MNELYHKVFGDDPDYRRRLWIATAIIFAAPMIRTGWTEIILWLVLTPFGEAPVAGLILLGLGAVPSLIPAGIFLLWNYRETNRIGLSWRCYLLLGLLLCYMPIQLVMQPNFYSEGNLEIYHRIKETLPWVHVFRHLDKPTLLLLVVWARRNGPQMSKSAQLSFNCLLFLCLIWALGALKDENLGFVFLFF